MSSYAAMDRHFPTTLTARLGPVNAEAIVVGDGGQYGDVSLGRYSTVIKPVSIPTSAPVNRQPFVYTVAAGEDLSAIASKFHVSVAEIRWSNTNLMSTDSVATGNQIVVPPVHGIVVTTKATDTIDSLAAKYQVDSQAIIDYNRLRTADVAAGTTIVIPGGVRDELGRVRRDRRADHQAGSARAETGRVHLLRRAGSSGSAGRAAHSSSIACVSRWTVRRPVAAIAAARISRVGEVIRSAVWRLPMRSEMTPTSNVE